MVVFHPITEHSVRDSVIISIVFLIIQNVMWKIKVEREYYIFFSFSFCLLEKPLVQLDHKDKVILHSSKGSIGLPWIKYFCIKVMECILYFSKSKKRKKDKDLLVKYLSRLA